MRKPAENRPLPRVIREDSVDDLGLEGFAADPDDQGLSLEELGDAYAALMVKGADPYAASHEQAPAEGISTEEVDKASAAESAPPQVIRGEDEASCEITPKSILEAILFVGHPSGEPLTSQQISGLMRGVIPSEVDDLVDQLNAAYASEGAVYAIQNVGPGYRLQLREEYAGLRDKFLGRVKEARLSQATVDILAIVAYKQPIAQAEVDRLRGKPSGGLLSQLVRRDLLQVEHAGRKGAKSVYTTTSRFLDLFGLDSLADLPRNQEDER
jgi:segregation and condensation protein B